MSDQARIIDRQGVLSRFGDFVLDHDDLDDILNEGCRLVASALGADLAKVIEIDHQTNTGFVRAGFGWNDGIVGEARIELGGRSSEAYAIEKTTPVISNDIATEDRFTFPSFLRAHGVVALINVPILLPGRVPYGILQVDARQAREFDQQDVEFLKTYAMVLGPVIDRLRTMAELRLSDERLRLLVDNARAYVLIVSDRDGRVTDWLGGSEEILGWSAQEAIGQNAGMIFTEADRAAGVPERELSAAREKGSVADVRWHRRKDGTPVFLNGQTIALRERSGKLRGYYKIGQTTLTGSETTSASRFFLTCRMRCGRSIPSGTLQIMQPNVSPPIWTSAVLFMVGFERTCLRSCSTEPIMSRPSSASIHSRRSARSFCRLIAQALSSKRQMSQKRKACHQRLVQACWGARSQLSSILFSWRIGLAPHF